MFIEVKIVDYIINNLSEFITLTALNNFSDYYFRGENSDYRNIDSSLLRHRIKHEKSNVFFYEELINGYYSEVASRLSEKELQNFLAFSQHHGLYTNLIDFTTKPVIALYFACDNCKNRSKGYVYLVNKKHTLDISNVIIKYFSLPVESLDIIGKLYNRKFKDQKFSSDFLKNFNIIDSKKEYEKYIVSLWNQFCQLNLIPNGDTKYNIYDEFPLDYKKLGEWLPQFYNKGQYYDKSYFERFSNVYNSIYINMLYEYLSRLDSINVLNFNDKSLKLNFPKFPYLIYKPSYKFDRMINQEGLFIYQCYYRIISKYRGFRLIKQKIEPDIVIEINNQAEILKELDSIGINKKFIYGDYDSIATYVNMKNIK